MKKMHVEKKKCESRARTTLDRAEYIFLSVSRDRNKGEKDIRMLTGKK